MTDIRTTAAMIPFDTMILPIMTSGMPKPQFFEMLGNHSG
jgi:hypothetical protein